MNVTAIILSAGSSRRMGKPKALLKIGRKFFLQHIIDEIEEAGINNKVVVLGAEFSTIKNSIPNFEGTIVVNGVWEKDQLTSIIAGLNEIENELCDAVLIVPVDHPLISSSLIKNLIDGLKNSMKKIIIPTFNQRRGHPIIITKELFNEIKSAPLEIGLRSVVRSHAKDILEVPTKEQGILINIDTPEDYQQHVIHRG